MVKTTIKYVRSLPYKSTASYFIKHLPDLIQFLILIALILTFAEYRKANRLTRESLEIAQKNIELSQKSIDLTQQSVSLSQEGMSLNQKNMELAQKSIALTQESVESTQEGLKYSEAANNISRKSLELSNTPWVTIVINKVSVSGADEITISYTFTNHSDSPAENVNIVFALDGGERNVYDLNFGSRDLDAEQITLSPHQEIGSYSRLISLDRADLIKSEIYHGKCQIDALITYSSPSHISRITCDQIFAHDDDGVFDFVGTKYDTDTDNLINAFFNRQIAQDKAHRKNK